jgi:hypothetical protein
MRQYSEDILLQILRTEDDGRERISGLSQFGDYRREVRQHAYEYSDRRVVLELENSPL